MRPLTPREFALDNLESLRRLWRGVHDGEPEKVHDARIATRRIREALPICGTDVDKAVPVFRRIGRRLGSVRELDATDELIATLGNRFPPAAVAAAAIRRDLASDRDRARQKLVKALLLVDLKTLAHAVGSTSLLGPFKFWQDWRTPLFIHTRHRAESLRSALDRAAAIYIPKRLHQVRIATKKLRYSIEMLETAGQFVHPRLLKDLKKGQETLGRMHDLQMALGRVRGLDPADKTVTFETRLLDAIIQSECRQLHEKYLGAREHLYAASQYAALLERRHVVKRMTRFTASALPIAGAVAVRMAITRHSAAPELTITYDDRILSI